MASFASSLSPVPSFPEYTGPYKVGTIDVELPVSGLDSPSPAPDGASEIHTVLFRIFYPAVPEPRAKRVSWLPAPQRLHIAAYTQFVGAGTTLASILSFLPRHLHWTSIPAHKNATLIQPPADRPRSRWPTVIFSHGLGGNRNAYSYLAGSLASYGVVVICPEHRDGSAALTLIRNPKSKNHKRTRRIVPYIRLPHTQTREIWDARNKQLRIRLWELGLIFEALTAIDRGHAPTIASNLNHSTPQAALTQFTNALDILEPGKVIFSGHSFGAVTAVQLLKSTHPSPPETLPNPSPLFTPSQTAAITRQITPANPTILLDMWCFPLLSASTAPLYNLPLPCYSPGGPGGSALLAIESMTFFNWTEHLHAKARILSPDPTARTVTASLFQRPSSAKPSPGTETETETEGETETDGSETETEANATKEPGMEDISRPNFFYVTSSAHLSQSDFGILFPRLTKRVFKSDRPERVLRLNVRAQLQFLRDNGVVVAGTASGDLVDGGHHPSQGGTHYPKGERVAEDGVILQREKGRVEAWEWIDVVGLGGDKVYPSELDILEGGKGEQKARAEEGEREMEAEIEPSMATVIEGVPEGGLKEGVVAGAK